MTYIKPLSSKKHDSFGIIIPKDNYFSIFIPNYNAAGIYCTHYRNSILFIDDNFGGIEKKILKLNKKKDKDSTEILKAENDFILLLNDNSLCFYKKDTDYLNNSVLFKPNDNYTFEKHRYNWIKPEFSLKQLNKKIEF
ncbi:MAG: hypothetical protein ACLFPJ_02050 [Candidatus Woesearchaeota archaeon]